VDSEYTYDVFVSYASDDGAVVARSLESALILAGLKVWLDAGVLSGGDRLGSSIARGIGESGYVVVIVSPAYLERGREWTEREMELAREVEGKRGRKVLIPVWHDTTPIKVREVNPELADLLGIITSFISSRNGERLDIDAVAIAVLKAVAPESAEAKISELTQVAEEWRRRLSGAANRLAVSEDRATRVRAVAELAELADSELGDRRQACIDMICGTVRRGARSDDDWALQDAAMAEVRRHLDPDCPSMSSWQDHDFDFTRAVFRSVNLMHARIRGGLMDFHESVFEGDYFNFFKLHVESPQEWQGVRFGGAVFRKGIMCFDRSEWLGGTVDFSGAVFEKGRIQFRGGTFTPGVGTRDGKEFPGFAPPSDFVVHLYQDHFDT
jgi:hypothetical protein